MPDDLHDGLIAIASAITAAGGGVSTLKGITIANLPATPGPGMIGYITDGDSGLAWGATAVNSGGSTTKYLVWYNGVHWTVFGK